MIVPIVQERKKPYIRQIMHESWRCLRVAFFQNTQHQAELAAQKY